ncbi:hypothetical protein [Halobacteriovorax sp. CON-3]|uniref:hypothetical protein n=1 Tax=Halobacteriovorax sp. CON-3 TaxID=3157710 RepID=UPI003712CB05
MQELLNEKFSQQIKNYDSFSYGYSSKVEAIEVQALLKDHFNVKFSEVILYGEPSEWLVSGNHVEVVRKDIAYFNDTCLEQEEIDTIDCIEDGRIGCFKRLSKSEYYFRWM